MKRIIEPAGQSLGNATALPPPPCRRCRAGRGPRHGGVPGRKTLSDPAFPTGGGARNRDLPENIMVPPTVRTAERFRTASSDSRLSAANPVVSGATVLLMAAEPVRDGLRIFRMGALIAQDAAAIQPLNAHGHEQHARCGSGSGRKRGPQARHRDLRQRQIRDPGQSSGTAAGQDWSPQISDVQAAPPLRHRKIAHKLP